MFTDRALQLDDSRDGIFNYAGYHDLAIRSSGEVKELGVWAAAYGARVLKSRYILLRLEDFRGEARQDYALGLAQKLKLDKCRAVAHLDIFRAPASLGRWKGHAEELPALTGIFGTALGYFGYY